MEKILNLSRSLRVYSLRSSDFNLIKHLCCFLKKIFQTNYKNISTSINTELNTLKVT